MSAAALALLAATGAFDSLDVWGRLEAGPHRTGFRVEQLAAPRRISLYVWYPAAAAAAAGPRLRFGDYYSLHLQSRPPGVPAGLVASPERALVSEATGDTVGMTDADARRVLSSPMRAVREAKPAAGPFPLVLWSSRHGTMAAQAVLAEFLASHGLVVVFAWSGEPPLVYPWEQRPPEEKEATVAAQVRDLEAALRHLRRRPEVRADRTGLLAWSYGGTAARRLANAGGVNVLVSLSANTLAGQPAVVPAREGLGAEVPLVYLEAGDSSRPAYRPVPSVFDSLGGRRVALVLPALAHGNFNTLEGTTPVLVSSARTQPWVVGGEPALRGFDAIARITLHALRSHLVGPPPARAADLARALEEVAADDTVVQVHGEGSP